MVIVCGVLTGLNKGVFINILKILQLGFDGGFAVNGGSGAERFAEFADKV